MKHNTIQSFNCNNDQITVLFEQSWYQEEISTLKQLLLNKIPDHQIKEITKGADRESVRFCCLNAEFTLLFDYYSQSCWFSAQDVSSTTKIQPLFNILTKKEPSHV